ncbi:MAG: transposase [Desulfobulbaceae bacterium]|nr:transposase [Desulfobulbaceae bacterium]
MARQIRLDISGALYHVVTGGLNRAAIFKDKADRNEFLRRLEEVLTQVSCRCYARALMTNHLHFLIRTSDCSLNSFVRKLLAGYAVYFNRKYRRQGYLHQNC